MNKKIGIVLKPSEIEDIESILDKIISKAKEFKSEIIFESCDEDRINSLLPGRAPLNFSNNFNDTDLIISLGGDGTLLGALRNTDNINIPIAGVNMGSLGFITEFKVDQFLTQLSTLVEGTFTTYEQSLFTVSVVRENTEVKELHFANDVVFGTSGRARMCELTVKAGAEDVYTLSGDGLIVSTPIGSTAYSMSAGGPITHKDVEALIISPICPHSLTKRPMVIPDTFKLEIIQESSRDEISLTIDGQNYFNLEKDDKIYISKANEHKVRFVKNPCRGFFSTLKEKFGD